MARISWRYNVKNTGVLNRIALKEPPFYKSTARLKMAYAGHVLRGSSGNTLLAKLCQNTRNSN